MSGNLRLVVLLCGPPGAGKTTAARESGLDVYDSDDPQWRGRGDFLNAVARLRADRLARAVVITSGATSSARAKMRAACRATHCYILTGDPKELAVRVGRRGRTTARNEIAGIGRWFQRFDDGDAVQLFPGWDSLHNVMNVSRANVTVREW